jgi:energy-coupling factor transporter transmembrane protein EcfT|tara:strand:+ start:102 stop:359 length:258 start_codon:yes stop_codon:yes gene_type:complete
MNMSGINSITTQQSRSLGKGLIVVAFLMPVFFLNKLRRRFHLVLALPVLGLVVGLSAFLFWIGYTMATTVWERPDDYPPKESNLQ